ncbi:hypothetical protein FRB95_012438 [Tulasnella sp. JGI-2019a]|nr:hypothetical protein FRB95_012438 [Tulasnella sp. JGI-2019a]
MLELIASLVVVLCGIVANAQADFSQLYFWNWGFDGAPTPCTPAIYNGGPWTGGPIQTLPFEAADSVGPLPITFSFNFTGTAFNVVGNDWHDGIVTFTLDGVASAPYDLGSAINSTAVRCRFPWYNRTGLAPTTHTFTFSLTAPSAQVLTDTGYVPGGSVYYGIQFFYFSYTPVNATPTSYAPSSTVSIIPTDSKAPRITNASNAAALRAGLGGVGAALFTIFFFL